MADHSASRNPFTHTHYARPEDETPGGRLRAITNAALADERRADVQHGIVNSLFVQAAQTLDQAINNTLQGFFNRVARLNDRDPSAVAPFVLESITPSSGTETYLRYTLGVNANLLDLAADDIRDMPGWIALHTKARDMDIAINLTGLTMEEARAAGINNQVILSFNLLQSYDEGAIHSALYPSLPPVIKPYNKRGGGDYTM